MSATHEDLAGSVLGLQVNGIGLKGVSLSHPFWSITAGTWREARHLEIGEVLLGYPSVGEAVALEIEQINVHDGPVEVFNVSVDGLENYFAEGLLVHNKTLPTDSSKPDPPPDNDLDGYFVDEDCDDEDSAVNPGAVEVCDDAVDNDCDGDTDQEDEDCG